MPIVGVVSGGVDFSAYKLALSGDAALGIGKFVQTIIDFTIIAFVLFMIIQAMNASKKKEAAAPAAPAPTRVVRVLVAVGLLAFYEVRQSLTKRR